MKLYDVVALASLYGAAPNETRPRRELIAAIQAYAAELVAAVTTWIPVTDRLPDSGVTVLAYYVNDTGQVRRIRAMWLADKTHESDTESDIALYDEATDTYYEPEGWYEKIDNWPDYGYVAVCEGEVSHWMPMPSVAALSARGET